MKRIANLMLAAVTVLAMSSVANAEIITLQYGAAEVLMPLFDRLASAQITSAVLAALIIGVSAIVCCIIMKKKS
jgi:hypothetical protein